MCQTHSSALKVALTRLGKQNSIFRAEVAGREAPYLHFLFRQMELMMPGSQVWVLWEIRSVLVTDMLLASSSAQSKEQGCLQHHGMPLVHSKHLETAWTHSTDGETEAQRGFSKITVHSEHKVGATGIISLPAPLAGSSK